MPGVLSSMDASDPLTASSLDATNRRKSGRAIQKPILYQEDPHVSANTNGSAKRKRTDRVTDNIDEESENPSSSEEDESEPDEEELKEKRRSTKATQNSRKKPAAKKPKTIKDDGVRLAMRPATNGVRKAAKSRKPRARVAGTGAEGTGLFAEVFYAENAPDDVATGWLERYNNNNAEALCELINFVLKCAGCDLELEVHDIEDPDNATNKLGDIQEEFQRQAITDYPLVSRAKDKPFSKLAMVNFFNSLVQTAHSSELLYNDEDLYEGIQIWVSAMSTSSSRPFRHTSTVISLSIGTAICGVMKEIVNNAATTSRQKEGEEKKKSANKGRIATLQAKIDENETKREAAEKWLRDITDLIFVHRYRDVDPKIRVDCTHAMGTWILSCPEIFFDGASLRYLGWLLSDLAPAVRTEVVKQLLRLYKSKDNVGRLRAFTERFRPRMVEMATQDADSGIRASMIELLDLIRELGLLEPDDVDTIGRMIFDTEPRVRKAVAGFFAENISDVLNSALEDLGGQETLDETLGEEAEEEYDSPRQAWLRLKCLVEVLDSYDSENSEEGTPDPGAESLIGPGVDTRYSMAANVVCDGVEDARDWEVVAGYLLYDNSTTAYSRTKNDPMQAYKKRCLLSEKEERLLLEILNAAVKLRLIEAVEAGKDNKGKKTKARKDESRTIQEITALHLAAVIPRLLRKFGAKPSTASPVLRLGLLLDLEIFQELRHDSNDFSSLLDDINAQFLSHADHGVLNNARDALLYARAFEDLEDVTGAKMQELWEGTANTLRQLSRAKVPQMLTLANTAHRIASLASITDCVEVFVFEPRSTSKAKPAKVLDILLDHIRNYGGVSDPDADSLVVNAMNAIHFYYMWLLRGIQAKVASNESVDEVPGYEIYTTTLLGVIDARPKLDSTRINAIGHLLDVYSMFSTFRHLETKDPGLLNALTLLVREVSPKAQQLVLSSFTAAEKAFAKKAKKPLESFDEEDIQQEPESDPEDSSEEEEDDDDDEGRARQAQHRQQELLLAEKRLIELTGKIVMAMVGRVVDASGPSKGKLRKRVLRNKTRLGVNFKEVLAYLDEPKKRSHKAKAKALDSGNSKPAAAAKSAGPVEGEDEEDADDAVEAEGEGEGEDEDEDLRDDESERAQGDDRVLDEIEDDVMGD